MALIGVFAIAAFIAFLLYLEAQTERQDSEQEAEVEYVDPWDSLPPKWSAPRAESDLGDGSGRRAA